MTTKTRLLEDMPVSDSLLTKLKQTVQPVSVSFYWCIPINYNIVDHDVGQFIMLANKQLRTRLKIMVVLAGAACLLAVGGLVYGGVRRHNGFVGEDKAVTCTASTYYQVKYSGDVYLKVFAVGLAMAGVSGLMGLILAWMLLCQWPEKRGKEEEMGVGLAYGRLVGCYVVGCIQLLSEVIVVGYCFSLYLDVRRGTCDNSYNNDWIIIGSLSLASLICMILQISLLLSLTCLQQSHQQEDPKHQEEELLVEQIEPVSQGKRDGSDRNPSQSMRKDSHHSHSAQLSHSRRKGSHYTQSAHHSKIGINPSHQSEDDRPLDPSQEGKAPLLKQSANIYDSNVDVQRKKLVESPSFANRAHFKAMQNDPQKQKPLTQAGKSVTNININFPNGTDHPPIITTTKQEGRQSSKKTASQPKYVKKKSTSSDEERIKRYRYEQSDDSDARFYKRSHKKRRSHPGRRLKHYEPYDERYETRRKDVEEIGYQIYHPYERRQSPRSDRERIMLVPRSTHDLRQYRAPEEQYYRPEQPYYPRLMRPSPSEHTPIGPQSQQMRQHTEISKSKLALSPQANLQVAVKNQHSPSASRKNRVKHSVPPRDIPRQGPKYQDFFKSKPIVQVPQAGMKSKSDPWQSTISRYFQGINSNPAKDYAQANNYASVLSESKEGKFPSQRQYNKAGKVNLDASRVSSVTPIRGAVRAEDMIERIRSKYQ